MDNYDIDPEVAGGLLAGFAFVGVIGLILFVIMVISMWKIFEKAGKPGWAGIIPFYNIFVMIEIIGRPAWWIVFPICAFVLGWIPLLGWLIYIAFVVIWIIMCIDLAKSFGKDAAYGVGLALLNIVFFPMLGFGSAQYVGPAAQTGAGTPPPTPPTENQ